MSGDSQDVTKGEKLFSLGVVALFCAAAGAVALKGAQNVFLNDPKDDVKITATVFGPMTDEKFEQLHAALNRTLADYAAQGSRYEWSQQANIFIGLHEHSGADNAIATDMSLNVNDRSPHTVIDIVVDGPATHERLLALRQLFAETFTREYLTDYNDVDVVVSGAEVESAHANNYLGYVSDPKQNPKPVKLRP